MINKIYDLLDVDVSEYVLEHYLEKAKLAIKQYCNIDNLPEDLNPAIIDLAIYFYRNRDLEGVRQATQGSRSQTLVDGIPGSIRACLPMPRLRVI